MKIKYIHKLQRGLKACDKASCLLALQDQKEEE
jgi:hypothetical protein